MNTLIKILGIVFLETICCMCLYGQSDSVFQYIPINLQLTDTSNLCIMQKQMGFQSKRIYKNGSFKDNHILCQSNENSCAIQFKIIGLDWYIRSGKQWKKFYSHTKNTIQSIGLKNNYYIEPVVLSKNEVLKSLYGFKVKHKNYILSEDIIYWFDPKKGIVIIENPEFAIIRIDFLSQIKR